MSIFDLILTLFQVVVYGTCGLCLSYLIFAVIYDVYILNIKPYFTHNREMTPKEKKVKTNFNGSLSMKRKVINLIKIYVNEQ